MPCKVHMNVECECQVDSSKHNYKPWQLTVAIIHIFWYRQVWQPCSGLKLPFPARSITSTYYFYFTPFAQSSAPVSLSFPPRCLLCHRGKRMSFLEKREGKSTFLPVVCPLLEGKIDFVQLGGRVARLIGVRWNAILHGERKLWAWFPRN